MLDSTSSSTDQPKVERDLVSIHRPGPLKQTRQSAKQTHIIIYK